MTDLSRGAIIAGAIAISCLALAGVLLIAPGPESTQRLGLYFGVIGTIVATLVALLKADQAQQNTNGRLDARIQAAVHRANNARRRGDRPLSPDELTSLPPTAPEPPDPVDPLANSGFPR